MKTNKCGVSLLQGPPGTGKTTVEKEILRHLLRDNVPRRAVVAAPSNKAVQVLASQLLRDEPEAHLVLIGVSDKIPAHLRAYAPVLLVQDILLDLKWFEHARLKGVFPRAEAQRRCVELRRLLGRLRQTLGVDKPSIAERIDAVEAVAETAEGFDSTPRCSAVPVDPDQIVAAVRAVSELELLAGSEDDDLPSGVEAYALSRAPIILATLSVLGRVRIKEAIRGGGPIDIVVIDEAAQTVEAECMIALQLAPRLCLLAGDVKQLPAVIKSKHARKHHFDWSMMWRLQKECRQKATVLDLQYRMHPEIAKLVSGPVYDGKLETAPAVLKREPLLPPHSAKYKLNTHPPVAFYNIVEGREAAVSTSILNPFEVAAIYRAVQSLVSHRRVPPSDIGIIAFYKAQVTALRQALGPYVDAGLVISTVDGFQV